MSPRKRPSIPVQPVQQVQPVQPVQQMATIQNVPTAQPVSNLSPMQNIPIAQPICSYSTSGIPFMQPMCSLTSTMPPLPSTQQISQLGHFSPLANQATFISSPSHIPSNSIPTFTSQPSVQLPIPEDIPTYSQLVTGMNDNGIQLAFHNFGQSVYQPATMPLPASSNESELPTLG